MCHSEVRYWLWARKSRPTIRRCLVNIPSSLHSSPLSWSQCPGSVALDLCRQRHNPRSTLEPARTGSVIKDLDYLIDNLCTDSLSEVEGESMRKTVGRVFLSPCASSAGRELILVLFLGVGSGVGRQELQADPLTTAQRAAPINAALSLVMTLTGMASSRGCMRPFPTNAFMNNGPDNLANILGAMPPPR